MAKRTKSQRLYSWSRAAHSHDGLDPPALLGPQRPGSDTTWEGVIDLAV